MSTRFTGGEGTLRAARGGRVTGLSCLMRVGLAGFASADAAYPDIGFRVSRAEPDAEE